MTDPDESSLDPEPEDAAMSITLGVVDPGLLDLGFVGRGHFRAIKRD